MGVLHLCYAMTRVRRPLTNKKSTDDRDDEDGYDDDGCDDIEHDDDGHLACIGAYCRFSLVIVCRAGSQ